MDIVRLKNFDKRIALLRKKKTYIIFLYKKKKIFIYMHQEIALQRNTRVPSKVIGSCSTHALQRDTWCVCTRKHFSYTLVHLCDIYTSIYIIYIYVFMCVFVRASYISMSHNSPPYKDVLILKTLSARGNISSCRTRTSLDKHIYACLYIYIYI